MRVLIALISPTMRTYNFAAAIAYRLYRQRERLAFSTQFRCAYAAQQRPRRAILPISPLRSY